MKEDMDIPIFIDGEEVVERPRFQTTEEFASYVIKIAEGRDFYLTVKHPHDEDSDVLAAHIGDEVPDTKCPEGCDEIEEPE